jgi:hypothetical protein
VASANSLASRLPSRHHGLMGHVAHVISMFAAPFRVTRAARRAARDHRVTYIGDSDKPIAAIVPAEMAARLQQLEDERDVALAEAAEARVAAGQRPVKWSELKAELGL